jgi:uncharacterized membrane protein YfcA
VMEPKPSPSAKYRASNLAGDMNTKDLLFLLVGFISGILSGAFGVGGAVITTPLIRVLGVDPLFAIASTLPAVFTSALTGSLKYHTAKMIKWRIVLLTVPVGILFAILGAISSPKVPGRGHVQMILTAIFLAYIAVKMTNDNDEQFANASEVPGAPSIIGAGAGFLSGLLGVGGGTILVPGFRYWIRLSLKPSIATSLVCIGILAIPSTITHAVAGHIDWHVAIALAISVIPGAAIGSRLALRAQDRTLRRWVAIAFGIVAIIYAVLETRGLLKTQ